MNCAGFSLNIFSTAPSFPHIKYLRLTYHKEKCSDFPILQDFQDSVFVWDFLEKKKKHRDVVVKNWRDFFTNRHRRNVWKALAMLWNCAWNFLITMPWQSKFNISFKSVCVNWAIVSREHVTSSQLNEMLSLYISARFCPWFYQEAHVLFC